MEVPSQYTHTHIYIYIPIYMYLYLVGGFNPSEKYESVGSIIPYGKKCSKTNHIYIYIYIYIQCEAPKIAKLVYKSDNYDLWYL